MNHLNALALPRQTEIARAAKGCWSDTSELIGAVVYESRNQGVWRPVRAAMLREMAPMPKVHMTAEQFGLWKKQARALVRITGRTETPQEDLQMSRQRFNQLSSEKTSKMRKIFIRRHEAMACAHYLLNLPKPCEPENVSAWFWDRFNGFASVAPVLDMDIVTFSSRINGYEIVNGVKRPVVADGAFLRALDWVWRFGSMNPYGHREPVSYWADQPLIER